ncbi:KilA-N domain-containing protein [Microcoleus sp. herbarium7]|uniref:KilA-N domain-containing protein n=1 Tax=Microcoleus sp. herbarium7 TaxID=3055435 RepID=UPI002FD77C7E
MRLKTTKELFEAFSIDRSYNGAKAFYAVQGGNTVPSDLRGRSETLVAQGTFAHPDIAIQFAQWCSPSFALWVSRQVRHLLAYGEVNIHHTEWSEADVVRGHQFNADDIKELY